MSGRESIDIQDSLLVVSKRQITSFSLSSGGLDISAFSDELGAKSSASPAQAHRYHNTGKDWGDETYDEALHGVLTQVRDAVLPCVSEKYFNALIDLILP